MEKYVLEGAQLISEQQLVTLTKNFTSERASKEIAFFLTLVEKEAIFLKESANGLHAYAPKNGSEGISCFQLILRADYKTGLFFYSTPLSDLKERNLMDDKEGTEIFPVCWTEFGFVSLN